MTTHTQQPDVTRTPEFVHGYRCVQVVLVGIAFKSHNHFSSPLNDKQFSRHQAVM